MTFLSAIGTFFQDVSRYFVGPDAFISYSRSDAFEYAGMLASSLTQRGFAVFCDQAGTPPGSEVPRQVLRNARSASVMVIVASPAAMASPHVLQELTTFGHTGRPLVPIIAVADGSGTAAELTRVPISWQAYVRGLSISAEPLSSVQSGKPSEEIQRRIALAVGVNTQRRRLRRTTRTATFIFLLLLAGTIAAGVRLVQFAEDIRTAQGRLSELGREVTHREERLKAAEKDLDLAQRQIAESKLQVGTLTQLADQETARARDQKEAAAQVWRALIPRFQDMFSQPTLACDNGRLILHPAFVIHIRSTWPENAGQPRWPAPVKDLLDKLAKAYFACYPSSEQQPVLQLSGHVGSQMAEEPDTNMLFIAPGTTAEYAIRLGDTYPRWVAEALKERGIPKEKLHVVSYGKEQPIRLGDGGDSDEDMGTALLNNRVEVRLK